MMAICWHIYAFVFITLIFGIFKYDGIGSIIRGDIFLFIRESFTFWTTSNLFKITLFIVVIISCILQYYALTSEKNASRLNKAIVAILILTTIFLGLYNWSPCGEEFGCLFNTLFLFIDIGIWYLAISALPISLTVSKMKSTDIDCTDTYVNGVIVSTAAVICILIPHIHMLQSSYNDFLYNKNRG